MAYPVISNEIITADRTIRSTPLLFSGPFVYFFWQFQFAPVGTGDNAIRISTNFLGQDEDDGNGQLTWPLSTDRSYQGPRIVTSDQITNADNAILRPPPWVNKSNLGAIEFVIEYLGAGTHAIQLDAWIS